MQEGIPALSAPIGSASAINSLNTLWWKTDKSLRNLSSGKNQSLLTDSPGAYAAALAYNTQAASLTAAQPGVSLASGSLSLGVSALSSVNNVLQAMRNAAQDALSNPSQSLRGDLQSQYNSLLGQVNNLVSNAGINGINLVSAIPSTLSLPSGGQGGSTLTVNGVASDSASLGLTSANWNSSEAIQATIGSLDTAISTVQSTLAGFGAPMAAVNTAQAINSSTILTDQGTAQTLSQSDIVQESTTLAGLRASRAAAAAALETSIKAEQAKLSLLK